jgi:hypothetical protein
MDPPKSVLRGHRVSTPFLRSAFFMSLLSKPVEKYFPRPVCTIIFTVGLSMAHSRAVCQSYCKNVGERQTLLSCALNAFPRFGRLNSMMQTPLGRTVMTTVSSFGGADMLFGYENCRSSMNRNGQNGRLARDLRGVDGQANAEIPFTVNKI